MKAPIAPIESNSLSFVQYIWKSLSNRKYIYWTIGLSVMQFSIFKIFYPFPDFFSDSYSYIFAAAAHLDLSIWPIGYSKFLSAFHSITASDYAFVAFQYFSLELAAIYFFFTVLYFYRTSKTTRLFLFIFCSVNPLFLYLSNTINSDAIFGTLSLLWITQLLWLIHRPHLYQVFIHAILLFLCFTVRNNAYYYPVIATIAFLLSRQNWKIKAVGIILPFFFIIPFIVYTKNIAYKITGSRQFSLFTGWQLANNALYIYNTIEVDSNSMHTPEAMELNRVASNFFQDVNQESFQSYLNSYVGNFFIRQPEAPLKKYFVKHFSPLNSEFEFIAAWGKSSAAFESFGKSIILSHPFAYAQYFIWPNIARYALPPLSHLEQYNYGKDDIEPIAQYWFNYPTPKVHCSSHSFQSFLIIYEAFFLLVNLYFLWQFLMYALKFRLSIRGEECHRAFLLISTFCLCNFGFSIISTVNILRYQVIPMALLLTLGLLISDLLEETAWKIKNKKKDFNLKTPPVSIETKVQL